MVVESVDSETMFPPGKTWIQSDSPERAVAMEDKPSQSAESGSPVKLDLRSDSRFGRQRPPR
ncbi:hypothetical protein RSSM_06353 [Rhodopirellula sallentina SM41]|uniref:Uncharacterized protein n=1 Tax=Rhodopirellula sallentina SM41 TaxID=1263870 RepID=M5TT69_9BACT|nr:hypothetical protein RSSM_06353 [Rhodopirellula sallentina SM41]